MPYSQQSQAALTPNLRFAIRDKAHASRRISSRHWAADKYIKDVALMMAQGRESIARIIQTSVEIRRVFANFVRTAGCKIVRSACTNMRAAKHRFESFQKPLGRTCLHLHACIRTALQVAGRTGDTVGERTQKWLLWLDSEKCIMLAMLADASDEALALTRLLDTEAVDPASIHREIHSFDLKITALFGSQKQCLNVFGYTSVMMNMLKEQIVYTVGKHVRIVGMGGGVPDDVMERCLGRMRSWIILARAAYSAEFPSWEIAQAFQIFDVRTGMSENPSTHIARLARSLNLGSVKLEAQWVDIFPRARALATSASSMTNKEAWTSVLLHMRSRKCLREDHPTDVLGIALAAYFAFGASTSGVEQEFSKSDVLVNNRRQHCFPATEEMLIKIGIDSPQCDIDTLIARARKIWECCYDRPRASPSHTRIDHGIKRKAAPDPLTERGFIAKRRKAATIAIGTLPELQRSGKEPLAPVARGDEWGESHSKELAFQRAKEEDKRADALAEQSLLAHEITPSLRVALENKKAKRLTFQRARERKATRTQAAITGTPSADVFQALRGTSVYVDIPCRTAEVARALRDHRLIVAKSYEAKAFVVNRPGQANEFITAASAVRGAFQVSPALIASGGKSGTAIKMTPMFHLPKSVFIASGFLASNRSFANFLQKLTAHTDNCKWSVHTAGWPALRATRKPGDIFVLALEGELGDFGAFRNKFTLNGLLDRICSLSPSSGANGLK